MMTGQPLKPTAAYTQLAVDDRPPKSSVSREDVEDDDIDELAGTSLINVPTQPFTLPSTKRESLFPTHFPAEATANFQPTMPKPLPSLPSNPPSTTATEPSKTKTKMKVLAPKSTNQKVISKKAKVPPKPNISPSVPTSSSIDRFGGTVAVGELPSPGLDDLDKRVSRLTRQADAQESETKAREKFLAAVEASVRPSPLQRGRSVLMTAKHAITRRLGSPSVKLGRFITPLGRKSSATTATSVNEASDPGNAVPRPLPVYESMRSRRETPESQENDPFSDKMEMDEAWSDFDIDFGHQKDHGMSARDGFASRTSSVNRTAEPASEGLLVQSKSVTSFSNKVSGLKQHPDPEFFSSSPVGFSTPRVRLKPTADANGQKRLSTVLVRSPLLPGVNSERDTTDDEDDLLGRNGSNAGLGSNMKRKSATEDLHSQMSKRAKTDSGASGETAVLAQGFVRMGTNGEQALQSVERIEQDVTSPENLSQGKGFGIFAMSKGKEAATSRRDSVESLDFRRHSRRYSSSVSRPSSVLFSRESRAKVPLLDSYNEDQMDIDELQTDDPNGRK
ncbi:MAG: hypothetical protein Q9168_000641 [Polycauliona sp. 1 TL-2023]